MAGPLHTLSLCRGSGPFPIVASYLSLVPKYPAMFVPLSDAPSSDASFTSLVDKAIYKKGRTEDDGYYTYNEEDASAARGDGCCAVAHLHGGPGGD